MYRPRISPEKLKKLYYIKRRLGIPMTEVLEMAIEDYLEKNRSLLQRSGNIASSNKKRPRKGLTAS